MSRTERPGDRYEKRQKLKSGGGRINHEQKRKIYTMFLTVDYYSDYFNYYFYFISGHLCGEHVLQ